jgi:hypothetical protein
MTPGASIVMKVERFTHGTLDDTTGLTFFVEALLLVMCGVVLVRARAEPRAQKHCFAVILFGQRLADARFHKRHVPRRRSGIFGFRIQPALYSVKAKVTPTDLALSLQTCVTLARAIFFFRARRVAVRTGHDEANE